MAVLTSDDDAHLYQLEADIGMMFIFSRSLFFISNILIRMMFIPLVAGEAKFTKYVSYIDGVKVIANMNTIMGKQNHFSPGRIY